MLTRNRLLLTNTESYQKRLNTLLGLFSGTGGVVGIERSGTSYWLYSPIQDGRYQGVKISPATVLGYTDNGISEISDRIPFQSVKDNNGTYATKTGTWVNDTVNASAYGGTYSYTATGSGYITFTTPANTKRIGTRHYATTNAGLVLVTIDGDNTKANMLQTAQQFVDGGTFPNTILVANGGTLNPTDRCIDMYLGANNLDKRYVIADNLAPGVHTVVLTRTGYKNNSAAAGARLYITGMMYNDISTTIATANIVNETIQNVGNTGSVYEYVSYIVPTGASTKTYVGNGHGYSTLNSATITVDGSVETPADGAILTGNVITYSRNSSLYHPEIDGGTTEIGVAVTTYTPHPTQGLLINSTQTWSLGGTVYTNYPGMFPINNILDRCANVGIGKQYSTLALNDGTKVKNFRSNACYAWDYDGKYAAMLYSPDLVKNVKNYSENPSVSFYIEDTAGGVLNKIYQARTSSAGGTVYAVSEIWTFETYWKIFRRDNTQMFPL